MRLLLLHLSSFHRPTPPRLFFSAARSPPPFHIKLAAAAPFSALRWKLPKVDLRSAFLAFSAGNGGSGGSGDASGDGKGDGDGDGDDGETGSSLAASWSPPEAGDKEEAAALLFTLCKVLRTLYRVYYNSSSSPTDDVLDPFLWILAWPLMLFVFATAFSEVLFWIVWIILLCYLSMGILAAAFCVYLCLHFSRQWTRNYEEIASNPPADTECCICLSTREATAVWRSLPCNHWFHSPCINSWIRINPTCPICKGDALRRT